MTAEPAEPGADLPDPVRDAIAYLGPDPSFAEAMRAIEAAVVRTGRTLRPAGTPGAPEHEAVLFRASPSMGFAPSDIAAIRPARHDWPVEMEVAFLGLYGPSSPLPADWTERIVTAQPGADNMRDFLDLFTHPSVALAWRIARDSRIHMLWRGDAQDVPSMAALALAGVVPGQLDGLDAIRLLPLAGLLAQFQRSAAIVERVVTAVFEVPAKLLEFVPGRARVPPEQLFRLGAPAATLGDAVLGESVPDVAGTVRLVLGPLSARQFVAFLPGGGRRAALEATMRVAVREPVRIELELEMAADASPGLLLGGTRLGWTSWLGGPGPDGRCPAGLL